MDDYEEKEPEMEEEKEKRIESCEKWKIALCVFCVLFLSGIITIGVIFASSHTDPVPDPG